MKTPLFTLIFLFIMTAYIQATAQSTVETPSFSASIYPVLGTFKVRVAVSKEYGKKFFLSVYDENQNLIYFDQLAKQTTQHRFDLNLNELANGKYHINLSDGKQPMVTKIIVKEQAVLATPILSNQILCLN
ncbi:hypothetical protein DR864_15805 [Runella rosea]|uniref:Por secretion system C-terminal sorting domain-containing protein n=1 Tax=Runella rosea TaxID=2259595 RepID=A0A344TKD9_9BACT|nr:hypothetical protein [Runella rosea]AXE19110.1 hypothetical protein DR864_15805 [Runella rosea]